MTIKDDLIKKLQDKTAKIGILGMGYVGMPLAVVFAEKGFNVLGIDPDARKVDTFNKGVSYIQDVPSETVDRLRKAGKLNMTADFTALAEMDAVSICVPTPLRQTGDPDMSFILSATEQLAKYVHKGMVVVLESTTYPGTTRELMVPMLTHDGTNGLVVGEDLFICFSPERVDPGREDFTTYNTPKVLGVAYQPDLDDVRESPALEVLALLRKKGALVEYHDPRINHIHHEREGWKMQSIADADLMKKVQEADAVVIVTNHKSYDYPAIVEAASFIFDSRNALSQYGGKENPKVVRL